MAAPDFKSLWRLNARRVLFWDNSRKCGWAGAKWFRKGSGVRIVRAVAMATSGTHGKDRSRPCQTSHPAVYIRQLVQSATHPPPLCTILTSNATVSHRDDDEMKNDKSPFFTLLLSVPPPLASRARGSGLIWKSGLCSGFNWRFAETLLRGRNSSAIFLMDFGASLFVLVCGQREILATHQNNILKRKSHWSSVALRSFASFDIFDDELFHFHPNKAFRSKYLVAWLFKCWCFPFVVILSVLKCTETTKFVCQVR